GGSGPHAWGARDADDREGDFAGGQVRGAEAEADAGDAADPAAGVAEPGPRVVVLGGLEVGRRAGARLAEPPGALGGADAVGRRAPPGVAEAAGTSGRVVRLPTRTGSRAPTSRAMWRRARRGTLEANELPGGKQTQ